MSLTGEDTNSARLQLSNFALITAKYENNNFRAVLKKSHYRKVGSKTILLKTETDLPLELTNLHDSLTQNARMQLTLQELTLFSINKTVNGQPGNFAVIVKCSDHW